MGSSPCSAAWRSAAARARSRAGESDGRSGTGSDGASDGWTAGAGCPGSAASRYSRCATTAAATARLDGSARRYAWTVVVLAAGLSGLAQASFLAGGVERTDAVLRFGVGAWPAVAAAVVAHLLYLLAAEPVQPAPAVQPSGAPAEPAPVRPSDSPVRDRARAAAECHANEHGELPTVSHLMTLAQVSRGTAGDALKALRTRPSALHLVPRDEITRTQR